VRAAPLRPRLPPPLPGGRLMALIIGASFLLGGYGIRRRSDGTLAGMLVMVPAGPGGGDVPGSAAIPHVTPEVNAGLLRAIGASHGAACACRGRGWIHGGRCYEHGGAAAGGHEYCDRELCPTYTAMARAEANETTPGSLT